MPHSTLTSLFTDIAEKIRAKTGSTEPIMADDFPSEIEAIPSGITPTGSISITENGAYDVTEKASAVVNVSASLDSGMKYEIGSNGTISKITYYGETMYKNIIRGNGSNPPYQNVINITLVGVKTINDTPITEIRLFSLLEVPSSVERINGYLCTYCDGLTTVRFYSTPNFGSTNPTMFYRCNGLRDIYVPWSEGEVNNAPWGATNATIHYDWTPTV